MLPNLNNWLEMHGLRTVDRSSIELASAKSDIPGCCVGGCHSLKGNKGMPFVRNLCVLKAVLGGAGKIGLLCATVGFKALPLGLF